MAATQNTTQKDDKAAAANPAEQQQATESKPAALEEDDEFEDFPVDGTPNRQPTRRGPQTRDREMLTDGANRLGARGHRGRER
jgi:hypothetical protein